MTAGAYLESSLMTDPQDALTMRLAQDCYLEAGSAENALGCSITLSLSHLHRCAALSLDLALI